MVASRLLLLLFLALSLALAQEQEPPATKAGAAAAAGDPPSTTRLPARSAPAAAASGDVVGDGASPWPPEQVRALKRTVVSIDEARPVALTDDKPGAGQGTGFVVDADKGIVVTNRHISTVSPAAYRLRFFDGSVAPANVLYYDVSQDFAVLKFDPSATAARPTAVTLGNSSTVAAGDPVLIIGNNEGYVFSAIEGVVSDVRVLSDTAGTRPSIDIDTTTDSGGGSSGSPVWNAQGQVVAVNYAGDTTSARVVPINYVLHILKPLLAGDTVARGDAGLVNTLVPVGDAVRHFKLPADAAAAAVAARGDIGGVPKVILVSSLNPKAPAAGVVKPGDIVFAADGAVLADDLAALDRAWDAHVGEKAPVTVYRNGVKQDLDVPTHDLEKLKTRRFARFAGGTFQDLSERALLFMPVDADGVFMPDAEDGSSFGGAVPPRGVVVALNGVPTPTLDVFIREAAKVEAGAAGSVQWASSRTPADPTVAEITYDTRFSPLEVFAFDDTVLEWVKEA